MHRLAFCLLMACGLWSAAAHAQSYTFTTLAGLAGASGSADGMSGDARFYGPQGIALDSAGNLYVTDTLNRTIRKVTPAGVVSTLAGLAGSAGSADGPGNDARFNWPIGLAIDNAGNLYVADTSSHTIRKVTPDGTVSTLAGLAGFSGSTDGAGSDARFNRPNGVAVDNAGNLYVTDNFNFTIRKVTPDGVVSTLAGLAGSKGSVDGPGSTARFGNPYGIAVDSMGNVFVTEKDAYNTLRKVTPDGVVSTLAGWAGTLGHADGTGSAARFYSPSGVVLDSAGNLYVSDTGNCTLRKVTPAGVVSTLAGLALSRGSVDGPGNDARFNWPTGLARDNAGNLYVADLNNFTIRFGQLASVTPPSLRFNLLANHLILSWPQSASNCVLETSSTLSPGATWTSANLPMVTSGDSFVLTNTLDTGARFYRLRTP